jgi:hypothetical protein
MAREIVVALGVAGILVGSGTAGTAQQDQPTHPAAQAALQYFESVKDADFEGLLIQLRRPPPSPTVRTTVIRNLPKEGALTPTPREAAKLAAIRPLLAFHQREAVIETRLFTAGGQAFVGLHARTILLISSEALDLLDTDEIVAIMAHELGHDYVWNEYETARRDRDNRRLQELELRCDGIATIAMARLGVDPQRLISAVTKQIRYNERLGTLNYAWYVPLDQRVRFILAVARLTAGSALTLRGPAPHRRDGVRPRDAMRARADYSGLP